MKRRILISMAVMLLSLPMCGNLWAESSGSCGDNITWTLDDDDNLTLTGSGQMADYNETYEHPWSDNVKTVKFAGDITGIGSSAFRGCRSLTSIEIPNSVTSIGINAFSGCSSLTSIEIPNSVTSIGDAAFYNCSSLSSVSIPNSVTSIGIYAFTGCRSLSSIEIPNSVTSIGNLAFYNCNSLKKITVNATTPPDCSDYIFEGVDYSSCVLVVPDESISAYKNKSPWNQFLNISEVESVINDNEVSVKVDNGNIVVTGIADDVNMEVYNISGSRIYSGIVKSVQVPTAGLYLVKVLDKSYKIMVR